MNRRQFLTGALAASVATRTTLHASEPTVEPSPWRRFHLTTTVTLPDDPAPVELWVPLAQTNGDCQDGIAGIPRLTLSGGVDPMHLHDARYGAHVAYTHWDRGSRFARQFEVQQTVAVRDRSLAARLAPFTEAERKFWTAPTASVPLDGAVLATAAMVTAGRSHPHERLRAIYDWVIDHTHRDPDVPGCGRGDVKGMLESGKLGGKCADINGLMVGLARAAGFPARDVYGIRVAPSTLFPSLGAGGDISRAQHCRAEVFLGAHGWFPVDPADVCKAILAEKLAPDSPEIRNLRDRLFGHWETNWISYNNATDIELPRPFGDSHQPDFPFLMYPCAVTPEGELPCTAPEKFRYEINAREVPG